MAKELIGFPRHLTQHSGGFVITRDRLDEVAPMMNAAMEERTTVEWDKDDLDALGLLKVDVLALGMLTALSKGLDLLDRHYGQRLTLATIPPEEPQVYAMIQRADTIGVFQIESRAQMSMLPRLKPANFLRSRDRGRDRAPRPDPGRHGASLSAPPAGPRGGRLSLEGTRGRLEQDARRAAVPGAGDEDRHRRGRIHARGSRSVAPRDGDVPPRRHDPDLSGEDGRGHGGQRLRRASSPSAASARSRGSANTAFPRAMRRASRFWSTPRAG